MKKYLSLLVAVLMLISIIAIAEEVAPVPEIVGADVVTYVTDHTRTVAGIRVEYNIDITSGDYGINSYFVNGYPIKAVYVSESGKFQDAARTGKYVFAEFAMSQIPGSIEGQVNIWTNDNTTIDTTLDIFCKQDNCWFTTNNNIHLEAEDYIAGSVTSAAGIITPYQLYIPKGYEAKSEALEALPLVIWLHGGGESGTNNMEQLLANRGALNFSSNEAQSKHPCFVLAPQTNIRWVDDALVNVNSMVSDLIKNYNVDASRIYCLGCSMGGMGARNLALAYPDMLAAAVPIANNGFDDNGGLNEQRELFAGLPMIYITAADDAVLRSRNDERTPEEKSIEGQFAFAIEAFEALNMKTYASIGDNALNGYLRGYPAYREMKTVLDDAANVGAEKIFITYLAGTVIPAPHSSWMPATANAALHDWLFAQVNEAPYTPAD
jgi:predicted peptidase